MPPRVAHAEHCPPLDWAGFRARLTEAGYDPADLASTAVAARLLAGLWHDRAFLADHALAEVAADRDGPGSDGPMQTMLLGVGDGWYVRAALWPAPHDWLFARYGAAALQYGVIHDHNFSFLTLGYAGPGYSSDCWTRDPAATAGVTGEDGGLVPAGAMLLGDGEVRHYRAGIDVHSQRPPDRFSISINIVATHAGDAWRDQYRFDAEGRVADSLQRLGAGRLLQLAMAVDPDAATPLAQQVARDHPHPRMRLMAIEALATGGAGADIWHAAADDPDPLVRGEALRRAAA